MSYPRDNYIRVKEMLAERRRKASELFDSHRDEVCRCHPEFSAIEETLAATGMRIYGEAMKGADNLQERIDKLQKENDRLLSERTLLLKKYGYPDDYLDIIHECPLCSDEGNIGGKMCSCMRRELTMLGFESAGIGKLIKNQSFDTFDLRYYADNAENYKSISYVFDYCKQYAENFSAKGDSSLFFIGGTGLGKTHLCTSAAKRIVERGYDVIYETSANIFADFEQVRFGRGAREDAESKAERYLNCELLIIDDLGTEMSSQFTIFTLYNLLNSRQNSGRAMIINSNISGEDLLKRYEQRIYSRLFGEFKVFVFKGKDIRMQKLKRQ